MGNANASSGDQFQDLAFPPDYPASVAFVLRNLKNQKDETDAVVNALRARVTILEGIAETSSGRITAIETAVADCVKKSSIQSLDPSTIKLSPASIKEFLVTMVNAMKACFALALLVPTLAFGGGKDIYGNDLTRTNKLGYVDGDLTTVGDLADFGAASPSIITSVVEGLVHPWARAKDPPTETDPTVPYWAKQVDPPAETDPTVKPWAKADKPPAETDPTVHDWAKQPNPPAETDPTVKPWAKADKPPAETDPTVPTWAKQPTPPQTMTTNAVDALANSAVVTNALTVATTNRVALLESSKADKSALNSHVENKSNPHAVTAAQVGAVGIGDSIEIKSTVDVLKFSTYYSSYGVDLSNSNYGDTYHAGGYSTYRPYIQGIHGHYSDYTIQVGGSPNPSIGEDGGVFIFDNYDMTRYGHHAIEQWRTDGSLETLMYFPIGQQGMLALQNWQSLSAMLDSTNATTLAENHTFSNAVLAVGLNIDTNSVAVLNDIAKTFGGFPLGAGETATTVGGLLAALAAAIAWLKKNKVQTLKLNDNSVETSADGGVAKLDDFFTESNSLLTGTITAKSIPAFSSSSTYEVGEIVIYDGVAYKCVTAITPAEEWTAAHWTLATNSDIAARLKGLKSDGTATDAFVTSILGKQVAKEAIDEEIIEKGTAPDAHLEAPTDEHLKLILADNSVAYDSAKALPYKLTSAIGDRVIATMTLTAASTDITLPAIAANDTTVKDFILDVTNAYAVEGVATDAGINIPHTGFKLVTRDGESLTAVTTVKAGKSAFICFTQKSPVVVDGTTYPCWCVIQLPFGDPS